MVEKERFPGLAEYVHLEEPDWEAKEGTGLHFKRGGLTVDIEVPEQWEPGNQLTLAMTAKMGRGLNRRLYTWVWDDTYNSKAITNERAGFPDEEFDAILRLINQVSYCLHTLK